MQNKIIMPAIIIIVCVSSVALLLPRQKPYFTPTQIAQFFITPTQSRQLSWEATSTGALKGKIRYHIADYNGTIIERGEASIDGGKRLSIPTLLPRGYFEITLPRTGQTFGIVSIPALEGQPDPFFSIEAALSTDIKQAVIRNQLIEILKKFGISAPVDHMSWDEINPASGTWDWQTHRQYETIRMEFARQDLTINEIFHSAPRWTRSAAAAYPADLIATYQSWTMIAARWHKFWSGLQIWHEPELYPFGRNMPADQYAPLVKTVARAVHDQNLSTPLGAGGFTGFCPRTFMDDCARNGMLDTIDYLTLYPYLSAERFEGYIAETRAWLKACGKEALPLSIRESIAEWDSSAGRPRNEPGLRARVLDMAQKVIEARACGVARYFPYLYVPFDENGKNFGMLDKNLSPLPFIAAYFNLVRTLSHKPYVGDLLCPDERIKSARVFDDGDAYIAVLYTGEIDTNAEVTFALPVSSLAGIDGRLLPRHSPDHIPVPDGLTYVRIDRWQAVPLLQTNTGATRLQTIARRSPGQRAAPSPIVLQHLLPPENDGYDLAGYYVAAGSRHHFPLRVRINNFSMSRQTIAVLVIGSTAGQPPAVLAPPQTATVPPVAFSDVFFTLDLTGRLRDTGPLQINIDAHCPAAGPISPLVFSCYAKKQ